MEILRRGKDSGIWPGWMYERTSERSSVRAEYFGE